MNQDLVLYCANKGQRYSMMMGMLRLYNILYGKIYQTNDEDIFDLKNVLVYVRNRIK